MDPILPELREVLLDLEGSPALIPHYSTVTGEGFAGQKTGHDYWRRNVRDPVHFARAIRAMIADGIDTFVEVAAHPVLAISIRENLAAAGADGSVVPCLRRKEPDLVCLQGAVGKLFTRGYPVNFRAIVGDSPRRLTLPSYPWQRESYWLEIARTESATTSTNAMLRPDDHPLLGARLMTSVPTWQVELTANSVPYLPDHVVQGSVVLPGAAYVEMALASSARLKEVPHTATGAVGMAAFQLAEYLGAEIYTTAGTPGKRGLLTSLGAVYVGDSRRIDFAEEILEMTGGEGVDLVVNTLPAKTVPVSMRVLRRSTGRFVDLTRQSRNQRVEPFERPWSGSAGRHKL
jgi:acyl transferase domain-containing protein